MKLLFLTDTHLGFDAPRRPRVDRRRRGPDFRASYLRALAPALAGEVDAVVHGGDLLFRSRVPPGLVDEAFAPLRAIASGGIPVVVVPGNHERGRIPHPLLCRHPGVHVLEAPRTVTLRAGGQTVAIGGAGYVRGVRARFVELVAAIGIASSRADARFLVVHHCVEGATVGPAGHVFRDAPDVIRGRELPAVDAVLAGHVHRHQVLRRDLAGRPLPAPVLYAGSTERTSHAEESETKGYAIVSPRAYRFVPLPTRPMCTRELDVAGGRRRVEARLEKLLSSVPADAVLRVRLRGALRDEVASVLAAARLRALAPAMNVTVARGVAAPARPASQSG